MAYTYRQTRYNTKPRTYTDPEQLQRAIDDYIDGSQSYVVTDTEGNPVLDKWGNVVTTGGYPLTLTGLANAIGVSLETLRNYSQTSIFGDIVVRARAIVAQAWEEALYNRDAARGAQFALSNHWPDLWSDRREIVTRDKADAMTIDQLQKRLAELQNGQNMPMIHGDDTLKMDKNDQITPNNGADARKEDGE